MFARRAPKEKAATSVTARNRNHVSALEKGLLAIESFSASRREQTLSDVARRAGLTRAAARRYLHTLVAAGYAETDGKLFRLTPKALRLGFAYLSSVPLPQLAQPVLENIADQTQDVAALAVLDDTQAVFIACSVQRRIVAAITRVGTRLPAFSSSTGRVLLAGMPEEAVVTLLERAGPIKKITPKTKSSRAELLAEVRSAREHGFSLNEDEIEIGLRSISVPVRDRSGTVVAALGVSVHSARMPGGQLPKQFLPILVRAARELGAML
jgi:IclR family pca regulon transcriptional regulator